MVERNQLWLLLATVANQENIIVLAQLYHLLLKC